MENRCKLPYSFCDKTPAHRCDQSNPGDQSNRLTVVNSEKSVDYSCAVEHFMHWAFPSRKKKQTGRVEMTQVL